MAAYGQLPSEADINSAIPIYYNQMVQNLVNQNTARVAVTLSVASSAPAANLFVGILAPSTTTVAKCRYVGGVNPHKQVECCRR
jgi:hypothetical protein